MNGPQQQPWAVLAEELGFYPGSREPGHLESLRAQIAVDEQWLATAQKVSPTPQQLQRRYSHLHLHKHQARS